MQPRPTLAGLIALVSLPMLATPALGEAPWRFINLPDWHGGEKYVSVWPSAWNSQYASYEAYRSARQTGDRNAIQNIYDTFGGDLLIMPGDTQGGHWDETGFRSDFTSVPEYASLSAAEVVVEASHLCYSGMKKPFNEGGYPIMFVAVGDHEIGDNNWPANDPVAPLVPSFRQGFADIWNEDSGGAPLYTTPIGTAPARPLGTLYEETSYAVQHKNALFITVDIFRQDDPAVTLDPATGTVMGSMTGAHLAWFTNVLDQAKTIPSIKHVFVQSHLPTIYPVRKYNSSGMLVNGTTSSSFIQAMRDGGVDIYFAGEVHQNTVTVDDQSDLVQVVARGNGLTNVTTVDVEDDRISLALHHTRTSTEIGSLVIDKSGPQTAISGSGRFEPIDPRGLQNHYPFEQLEAYADVLTSANDDGMINGTNCARAFRNQGGFGDDYVAYAHGCTLVPGKVGQAVEVTPSSIIGLNTLGPIQQGYPRSVGAWFKTTESNRQIVFNGTPRWGGGQGFNLSLNAGKLELIIADNAIKTVNGATLNDGQWHHVAAVVAQNPSTLTQAKLYIDGVLQTNLSHASGSTVIDTLHNNAMAFGTVRTDVDYKLASKFGMAGFTGALDDICVWTRALTDAEIRAVAGGPDARGYDASAMEQLIRLAEAGTGSVEVNGDTWSFDPALTGPAGVFEASGSTLTLVLGAGGGMRTTIPPDNSPPTPDPAGFQAAPVVTATTAMLAAVPGSDLSGPVEYRFTETSGNYGGTSSGWQTDRTYTDTGLLPETRYAYTVTLRDALGNTGTASTAVELVTASTSIPDGLLIAWHTPDATPENTPCNDATPDYALAGVTGTLSGGRDARDIFNSTDLSYGSLATPAVPPGAANAVRVRIANNENTLNLSLANQTGGDIELGTFHFDFGGNDNAPHDFELRYLSGALANAANTLIATGSRPNGNNAIADYSDYDLPFSPALTDTTLGHGETATFRLIFSNPIFDSVAGGVDNIAIRSTAVLPPPDSDHDGIPDSVEDANGLNSANPADATLDKDGDGVSNFVEHLMDSAISDPADFMRLAVQPAAPGTAQVVVPRVADGRLYILEHSPDLTPPWRAVDAFTPDPADSGLPHAFPITTSDPTGFFRVRVMWAP